MEVSKLSPAQRLERFTKQVEGNQVLTVTRRAPIAQPAAATVWKGINELMRKAPAMGLAALVVTGAAATVQYARNEFQTLKQDMYETQQLLEAQRALDVERFQRASMEGDQIGQILIAHELGEPYQQVGNAVENERFNTKYCAVISNEDPTRCQTWDIDALEEASDLAYRIKLK